MRIGQHPGKVHIVCILENTSAVLHVGTLLKPSSALVSVGLKRLVKILDRRRL